jgi:hypothetical protein
MPHNRCLWVLSLSGGRTLSFQIPGNPPVNHQGGSSVHHLHASIEEIQAIQKLCQDQGILISARENIPQERNPRDNKDPFVRCPECLSCPWWDPVTLGPDKSCSLREAPKEVVESLMEYPGYREASQRCPVGIIPLSLAR